MPIDLLASVYSDRKVVRPERWSRVCACSGIAIRTYFLVARRDLHASNNDGHQEHEPGGDSGGSYEACKVCRIREGVYYLVVKYDVNTAMHVVYQLQCICAAANPFLEAPSPPGQSLWLRATNPGR